MTSNTGSLPLIAEAGQVLRNEWPQSTSAQLDSAKVDGRDYALSQHTAGYEIAGSACRWTDGYFLVSTMIDGARHGRRFRREADARSHFDQIAQKAS